MQYLGMESRYNIKQNSTSYRCSDLNFKLRGIISFKLYYEDEENIKIISF